MCVSATIATVDAPCGNDIEHNYVTPVFAGGAGAYHGRSLRIQFLANVRPRLGFEVTIKGDRIEASSCAWTDQPWKQRLTSWAGCWAPADCLTWP